MGRVDFNEIMENLYVKDVISKAYDEGYLKGVQDTAKAIEGVRNRCNVREMASIFQTVPRPEPLEG